MKKLLKKFKSVLLHRRYRMSLLEDYWTPKKNSLTLIRYEDGGPVVREGDIITFEFYKAKVTSVTSNKIKYSIL